VVELYCQVTIGYNPRFAYAWADLTVGAHACPSLKRADAAEFVQSLRDIVAEVRAYYNRRHFIWIFLIG
jgi:hypothetical protein